MVRGSTEIIRVEMFMMVIGRMGSSVERALTPGKMDKNASVIG